MTKINISAAIDRAKEIKDDTVKNVIPVAVSNVKTIASEASKFTSETLVPTTKEAYNKTKEKTKTLVSATQQKSLEKLDQNGDGKFDQEDVQIILDSIYVRIIDGISDVSKPIEEVCSEYLSRYKDPRIAAEKMIASDVAKCATSGFVSGFGGVISLPISIPANVASVLYVQMRMIAAVAYLSGLNVKSDATRTFAYACFAGVSVSDVVKQTGLKLGTKFSVSLIEKIPGKTLSAINQKVGFRLLTKFGSKGIINFGKLVPFVGAIIGGGFDFVETKFIAHRALKQFFDGDFESQNEIESSENILNNNIDKPE